MLKVNLYILSYNLISILSLFKASLLKDIIPVNDIIPVKI